MASSVCHVAPTAMEWLAQLEEKEKAHAGGGGGGTGRGLSAMEWLAQQEEQDRQATTAVSLGWSSPSSQDLVAQEEELADALLLGTGGGGTGEKKKRHREEEDRANGGGGGAASPAPSSAEEMEAMQAKTKRLTELSSEQRIICLRASERDTMIAEFFVKAGALAGTVLDEEEASSFMAAMAASDRDLPSATGVLVDWLETMLNHLQTLNDSANAMASQIAAKEQAAPNEEERVRKLESRLKRTTHELDEADGDLEDCEAELAALKDQHEKLMAQYGEKVESGRVAFEILRASYDKLAEYCKELEAEREQWQKPIGEEKLLGELAQAEHAFTVMKEGNVKLAAENRVLKVRLQWKAPEEEYRWDGANSDDDEDENGQVASVQRHPDAAGDVMKARKRAQNKEKAQKLTLAKYVAMLQRESARANDMADDAKRRAAILAVTNRELREANARAQTELADVRAKVLPSGTLLNACKYVHAYGKLCEEGKVPKDEMHAMLVESVSHLQDEVSSLKWRITKEYERAATIVKEADAKARQAASQDRHRLIQAESDAENREKQVRFDMAELKKKAAAEVAAAKEGTERVKQANERRTADKNKRIEELEKEVEEIRAQSCEAAAMPIFGVAKPAEIMCGTMALQILSVVAGMCPGDNSVIEQFHRLASEVTKAQLQGNPGNVEYGFGQLYPAMACVMPGDATTLRLVDAFTTVLSSSSSSSSSSSLPVETNQQQSFWPGGGGGGGEGGILLRDLQVSSETLGMDAFMWEDCARAFHPLLGIFAHLADYATRDSNWRQDAPQLRKQYEQLSAAVKGIHDLPSRAPPSTESIRAVKEALASPVPSQASPGKSTTFVGAIESFARGCIDMNTMYASHANKELKDAQDYIAKMNVYNKALTDRLEVQIGALVKGIHSDPSNPLDASDHTMIRGLDATLEEVEAEMRSAAEKEGIGRVPAHVEQYVQSVRVGWSFFMRTLSAMGNATDNETGLAPPVFMTIGKRARSEAPRSPTYQL